MQFNISFDPASPDLASLTASEQQAILNTANAAATIWSWYLTPANVTLDLQITVDNSLFGGNVLAVGGPAGFLPTGGTSGGKAIYDTNTAIELRTGQDQNGSNADLDLGLTVNSIHQMYFQTDPYGAVPGSYYDALSVFLHEIAHGLGFLYASDDPSFPGVAVFDTFVQNNAFTGPNAEAAYSYFSQPVRLDPNSLSHFDTWGSLSADLMWSVMPAGTDRGISLLDLGVLQDIGISLNLPTSGDDVIHDVAGRYGAYLNLMLGAGNDTGYALPTGGSRIFGEDGNDLLIGDKGSDYLDGGNGNDVFLGGGKDDIIFGGPDLDVARYSGLASDYQITRITNTVTQVKDLRSGSPDGTDTLYDVERLQWGDGSFFNLNNPPQLATQPLSSFKNQGLSLTDLASYSDPDGDAVAKYQLLDTTADPNSGYFIVNGVVQAAGTVITVTSAQFAYTTFVTGTVGDNLQIRAFDGYYWSAPDSGPWSPFTIAITAGPPGVTAFNVTAPTNQSLALSSLFSVTSDAPITQYQLWDGNNNPSSGYFVVNGAVQPAFTAITLTAAQLAQTFFVTGTAQDDDLHLSAFNGYYWSSSSAQYAPTSHVSLSGPLNYRPELTLGNWTGKWGGVTAMRNAILPTTAFAGVYDADGDAITRYQLLDTTTDPNSGHWAINGVAQPAGVVLDLTPAQWAQTTFVTGLIGDALQLRVFDGKNWSASSLNGSDFVAADTAWGTLNVSLAPYVITGTPGNDSLVGTAGNDQIYGLDGDDIRIEGGPGDDLLDGGPGYDWVYYPGVPEDYTIKLFRGGATVIGPEGTDTLYNIEYAHFYTQSGSQNIPIGIIIDGTSGNDDLHGTGEIYGYGGDDTIWGTGLVSGGDGDDMLTGSGSLLGDQGNDRLYLYSPRGSLLDGGPGTDYVAYNLLSRGDITVDLEGGVASNPATGNDTLVSIESAEVLGLGNATLIGTDGDNGLIAETSGVQTILAGAGNDHIYSQFGTGGLLDGGSGTNILRLDRANRYSGTGYPLVGTPYVTPVTLTFTPGIGGALPDGFTYSNFDYLSLDTGTGDDSIAFNQPKAPFGKINDGFYNWWDGGGGNDTVTVDLSGRSQSFRTESFGSEPQTFLVIEDQGDSSAILTLAHVENFHITSGRGNDQYTTGTGDDLLNGGPGNDILDGGGGADAAVFSGNRSAYTITRNSDGGRTITGPDGTDTLKNIESAVFDDRSLSLNVVGSDFNGDAKADLLWRNNDGTLTVWQWSANGALGSQTTIGGALDTNTWSFVSTGDYNGDGRGDILLRDSNGDWFEWFMNGAVVTGRNFLATLDASWQVRGSGDFDGDGRSDILWQKIDGTVVVSQTASDGTLVASTVMGTVDPAHWSLISVGDFNGDGESDVLLRNTNGTVADWLMNGPAIAGSNTLGMVDSSWSLRGAGDFNGDGKTDLLWQKNDGTLSMWLMGANGTAATVNMGTLNPGVWEIREIADHNGDATADILLRNKSDGSVWEWLLKGGSISDSRNLGTLAPSWSIFPGNNRTAPSDFGGNGISDVLWQKSDGTVMIWQFDSGAALWASTNLGVIPASWSLSGIADYNGDGRADVLLRNSNGTVANWIMGGPGILTSNTLGNLDSSWSLRGSGDFGGDRNADILWQRSDGTVMIWQVNGAGALASSTNLGTVSPAAWSLSAVGDFNGDGNADVLLRNTNGTVYDWLMNGAAIAGSNSLGVMDSTWTVQGTGDFNGDGIADIVWQKTDGTVALWQMNNSGGVGATSTPGTLTNETLIGVGDYNGDGKADLLKRDIAGNVTDWLSSGSGLSGGAGLGVMSTAWTAITR